MPGTPVVEEDISWDAGRLYAAHQAPLFRLVCRLLNGRVQDAEDVVQETFSEVVSASTKGRPRAPLRYPFAYLAKIAIRISRRRKLLVQREVSVHETDLLMGSMEDNMDLRADPLGDFLDLESQVVRAISGLTEPQCQVVYHCRILGETYVEAADNTGISVHMVEKHLISAMALLLKRRWQW